MIDQLQMRYERMKKADPDIGPIDTVFFFPTQEQANKAKRLLRSKFSKNATNTLRRIARREGVPASYLAALTKLEKTQK